jgi:hypothetical protein
MGGKWLELLKEIAPSVKRVAIMFNPDTAPGGGSYFLPSFNAAARSLNVTPVAAPVRSDAEIETAITMLGHDGGGLVSSRMGSCLSIARKSYRWRPKTMYLPYRIEHFLRNRVDSSRMDPLTMRCFLVPSSMSIASCAVPSLPIFPFKCRPNSS